MLRRSHLQGPVQGRTIQKMTASALVSKRETGRCHSQVLMHRFVGSSSPTRGKKQAREAHAAGRAAARTQSDGDGSRTEHLILERGQSA